MSKDKKTSFECVKCHSLFSLDYKPPEKWRIFRYALKDDFKYLCTDCGAFIYPRDLVPVDRAPDADIFYMFSRCINAYQCSLHDQYSAACEKEVLTPNCLLIIHRVLEDITDRLAGLEKHLGKSQKHLPGDRPARQQRPAGKKSDKGLK